MVLKDFAGIEGVFKLHPGEDSVGLMGRVLKRADVRTDLGRMSATITLTKEVEDRSGDLVIVKGIDLSDHRMHPIALFNHDKDAPIGNFRDPTGLYTVRAQGDHLTGELYFNQKSAFAHDVFECVVDKTFTAASIGFLPVMGAVEKRHPRGTRYGASRLVEGSIVTIGDNPHAGVQAIHKALGRVGASEVFKQYLSPLVPKRPASVTSGWERKAMMNPKDPNQDPNAQPDPAAEFMPTDDAVDPAADPNAQVDPHADHKAVADQAAENTAASIFDKFTGGQLDRKAALKLFDKILRHHEDISNIGGGDDMDADGIEDDEDGDGDEDGLDADDDMDMGGDDEESDAPPDLADKSKKRAEKAAQAIWHTKYAPIMSGVYAAIGHVVHEKDLDPEKAQAYLRKQLKRMMGMPQVDGLIKKALMAPADLTTFFETGPAVPLETLFGRNGTH